MSIAKAPTQLQAQHSLRKGTLWLLSAFSILTTGCAVNGDTKLASLVQSDAVVTGSVAKAAEPNGIDETDAEILKSTIAVTTSATPQAPASWSNSATGSHGTVVSVENFTGKHGQLCRGFRTTVNNFSGVAYYNGEACRIDTDKWVLSWFKIDQ